MDLYHLHSRTNCQFTVSCQFHDHSDVLLLLLFSLSYMQWQGRTALMLASEGGHLDVLKELLHAQADVNVQDEVCSLKVGISGYANLRTMSTDKWATSTTFKQKFGSNCSFCLKMP